MTALYNSNGVLIRESMPSDLDLWMKDPESTMRPLEIMEVWASNHYQPIEALKESLARSISAYSIFHNDKIVGMFGVVPDTFLSQKAMAWLLTTTETNNMKLQFLRHTRRVIEHLHQWYPVLYNWVDARNEQCLRWLSWAGATIYAPVGFGIDKMPFHYFELEAR